MIRITGNATIKVIEAAAANTNGISRIKDDRDSRIIFCSQFSFLIVSASI